MVWRSFYFNLDANGDLWQVDDLHLRLMEAEAQPWNEEIFQKHQCLPTVPAKRNININSMRAIL